MANKVYKFFDELEDVVRLGLSHRPFLYSFIGGFALVLFWRGVWHLADVFSDAAGLTYLESAVLSIALAVITLGLTGLFVSEFVGEKILMSGQQQENKIVRKTEETVSEEKATLVSLITKLERIEEDLDELKQHARRR